MPKYSWFRTDFNYAVQLGEREHSMRKRYEEENQPHCGGDTYEEHCREESKPWRYI